jgi:NACalpha-BTF3-like transcription factor
MMAMENRQKLKIPFVIKLCSDKAAFEVKIQRKICFNMADLERLLKSVKENEIIVNTPHILIFRSKGAEVTLSINGRMLIKKARNEKEATAIASEVLRVASKALL